MASLDQPRIRQTLSVHSFDEAIEPVKRVNLHITFVQAKGEFINIAVKVLRAGMMVDAVHPALHDCPDALNGTYILESLSRKLHHFLRHPLRGNLAVFLFALNPDCHQPRVLRRTQRGSAAHERV